MYTTFIKHWMCHLLIHEVVNINSVEVRPVENDDIQQRSNIYNDMYISDQRDISLLCHRRAKWIYILRLTKVDERYEPKNWINSNVLCNLK